MIIRSLMWDLGPTRIYDNDDRHETDYDGNYGDDNDDDYEVDEDEYYRRCPDNSGQENSARTIRRKI